MRKAYFILLAVALLAATPNASTLQAGVIDHAYIDNDVGNMSTMDIIIEAPALQIVNTGETFEHKLLRRVESNRAAFNELYRDLVPWRLYSNYIFNKSYVQMHYSLKDLYKNPRDGLATSLPLQIYKE